MNPQKSLVNLIFYSILHVLPWKMKFLGFKFNVYIFVQLSAGHIAEFIDME